jgi:hypothetical protein
MSRAEALISKAKSIGVMVFSSFSSALIGLTWTGLKAGAQGTAGKAVKRRASGAKLHKRQRGSKQPWTLCATG